MGTQKNAPISAGTARQTAARRMGRNIINQDVATVAEAMRRVQPRHKGYVMRRAEGMTPTQAWLETQPNKSEPASAAARLEQSPVIRTAIDKTEEVVLKGSLMSAAQRRDWVLDRLIVESTQASDSARVRSLELIGKTADLFLDRAEVTVTDTTDIKQRIQSMIESIKGRSIEAVFTRQDDGQLIDSEEERSSGDDSADPHHPPTHPVPDGS